MIDIQAENWLPELLPHVAGLAREAGQAIMDVYSEENPTVEYKHDNSPLTQADLASHRVIVNGLGRLSPDWPVLSEESAEIPFRPATVLAVFLDGRSSRWHTGVSPPQW